MKITEAELRLIARAAIIGDSSQPDNPRIRTLKEELGRVVRSRAVNPKWIAGMKRHGYKGAFELAATVDYLFGFDATSELVDDHQYALLADAYLLDKDTRDFIQQHNPGALQDMLERLLMAQIAQEIADITISAENLWEIVMLRRLSEALMRRIQKNYRSIVGINATLILLGVTGILQPTTSALLHNMSTLTISLTNMKNLLDEN